MNWSGVGLRQLGPVSHLRLKKGKRRVFTLVKTHLYFKPWFSQPFLSFLSTHLLAAAAAALDAGIQEVRKGLSHLGLAYMCRKALGSQIWVILGVFVND